MNQAHYLIKGTFYLTAAGVLSRIAGFFYKIFLSRAIGAEEIGLFHLCMPVFAFCMAASSGGIQTVVSRFTAEYHARNERQKARQMLVCALALSLVLSLLCTGLLWRGAGHVAVLFLAEPRCQPLLRLIALSLPFAATHACVAGYFMGKKQVTVPALSQLVEQFLRIGAVLLVCAMLQKGAQKMDATVMAIGQVAGELASASFCSLALLSGLMNRTSDRTHRTKLLQPASDHPRRTKPQQPASDYPRLTKPQQPITDHPQHTGKTASMLRAGHIQKLLTASAPLAVNRMLLCVLQAIEAALLPLQLRAGGLDPSEALTIYGTLTGMAMPLLMFPTAVTGSIGTLLLPLVSEARALNQSRRVTSTTGASVLGSLLLGLFFFAVYFLSGSRIGVLLFDSALAGEYVRCLSLVCPFFYINTTIVSILHGLGLTAAASVQNTLGLLLRLASVALLVPSYGIRGYFLGMLASQLLVTMLALLSLHRKGALRMSVADGLIRPVLLCILTIVAIWLLQRFVPYLARTAWIPLLLSTLLCLAVFASLAACCYLPRTNRDNR